MVFNVYIDMIFFINLMANYCTLSATAMVTGAPEKKWRIITASMIGGIYGTVIYMFDILNLIWIKLAVGVIMVVIAFGIKKIIRMFLSYFGLCAVFAGVSLALGFLLNTTQSFYIFSASVFISYLILLFAFRPSAFGLSEKKVVELEVTYNEKTVKTKALVDTGNTLCDPLTNTRVAIIEFEALAEFFTNEENDLILRMREEDAILALSKKFRLIPYKTIEKSAFLLAFKPDKIKISGKEKSMLVAICKNKISDGGVYSALVGTAEV